VGAGNAGGGARSDIARAARSERGASRSGGGDTRRRRWRRGVAAVVPALALLCAAGAGGAPINGYTATSTPTVVQPSSVRVYTIQLTNDTTSPARGQRARIGIPPGFSVSAASGVTSAAGICTASAWIADGTLIANGAVNLKKSGGNVTELCPGATLTVSVTASAPADGLWTWSTELLRDTESFALHGSQPTVRVDGTAPVVSIDSAPANPSNDPSPTFSFSADEPGITYACRLDDATFSSCASPRSYSGLADGEHTFRVRATDEAGNVGPTVTHTWTIGTVAPLTTISSAPASPVSSAAASFSFSSAAADATFECRLDAADFQSCTSPTAYSGLSDGQHSFEVRATDGTGTGSPIGHTWVVDTTAPVVTVGAKPSSPTNSTTATFSFSANESGTTFQCKLDSAALATCTSPKTYGSLADGSRTFTVQGRDRAGNLADPVTYAWTVDTTAPDTTITSNPPPQSPTTSASFAFTATEAGSSFECRLDAQAWAACATSQTYDALGQGAHTFSVRATDGAGNVDATPASVGWVVDTVAPDTTIDSKPSSLTNNANATFAFSATETGAVFECKLDLEADFSTCASPKNLLGLADGQHVLAIQARDAAGNVDPTPASHTWTVDTTPPDTTIGSAPPDPSSSGLASFTFASESGATFECKLDGLAFASCTSPTSYTPPDGTHTFQVRALDAAGNADPTPATSTWRIDTLEPDTSITLKPALAVNVRTATFAFSSSDAGVTYECRLDTAPFAGCESPKTYTDSDLPEGQHTFAVRARDSAGNSDLSPATYAWTVDVTDPETSILGSPPNPTTSRDATITFGSNEVSVTYACKMDGGTFATCTSPKVYTSLSEGSHTVQVRATDAAGNADATPAAYSWTVDATPPETTITSPDPPSPTNTTETTFTFSSDQSPASFECRLDGAAYATCTSPKTYSGLSDGSHTFDVRAYDAAQNVDPTPATRTWIVDTVAPSPTITLPIDGSAMNDTTPAFAGTAGNGVGDSPFVTVRVYAGAVASGTPLHAFAVTRVGSTWVGASAVLADGVYTARAEQMDAAGNTGVSSSTTFTIDMRGPGAAITDRPADPSSSSTAAFRFSSSDPAATFKCRLDAGEFVACTSPLIYDGLAPGVHTFFVNATDQAGNTGGNASYSWTVAAPPSQSPPATSPAAPPAAPDVVPPQEVARLRVRAANASVSLTWTLPRDSDFDHVSVVRIAPGKSARRAMIYHGAGTSFVDRGVKNGIRYRYRVTTHDRTGNTSAGVEVSIVPSGPLVAPANGARVTAPPLLRWQATPRATYYNVQLWVIRRGKPVKVLSAWPVVRRFQLASRWTYEGKAYRLAPGRYVWFVFPGYGKRSAERYGKLLGESSFTVKARAKK
jgi:large repetitive protein